MVVYAAALGWVPGEVIVINCASCTSRTASCTLTKFSLLKLTSLQDQRHSDHGSCLFSLEKPKLATP